LPPIQMVAGIIFENENVVDLVLVPNTTRQTKQEKKEVDKEITGVDLPQLAIYNFDTRATHL
jgi:hypothetical protein